MRATVEISYRNGVDVRPEARQLEGKTYNWTRGWMMDETDPWPGEIAWLPDDASYPTDAPVWIASGDLVVTP